MKPKEKTTIDVERVVEELKNEWLESSGVSVIEFLELFVGGKLTTLLNQVEEEKQRAVEVERDNLKGIRSSLLTLAFAIEEGAIQGVVESVQQALTPSISGDK